VNASAPPIRIIGVPLDLGSGRRGVDMGPSAVRVAGLQARLAALGRDVEDQGDVAVGIPETSAVGSSKLRFAEAVLGTAAAVAQAVASTLGEGRLPLILGGDHSIAIGSVAGSTRHFAAAGQRLGVVWLDAHGDLNTPETSPSGNIHGMSLAVLLGHGDRRLTELAGPAPKLDPRHMAIVGVRDLDAGERALAHRLGLTVFTMREIDELGVREVMRRAIDKAAADTAGIHVQLDMDVLDPSDAPGTGTPVRGGLSYREAHLAMELLSDSRAVRAADMVEINPILDERNCTAELGLELMLSLMGKRIL